ncbi:MAG TPA: metallophosphoesterase family protein, partial [Actinomycetota bacterium]|nr:metallophosphoesterase family protein [Actinomycetota bacterium]
MRLPRLSRVWRLSAPALAGLLGAWIALLAFGAAGYRVGPLRVELDARPGSGITELALPPLGRVRADTHLAPLTLSARVDEVAPERAEGFIRSGDTRSTTRLLEKELRVAVRTHAWRTGAIALAGALVAAVVLYGKRRRAIASALAATFVATLLFGSAVGLGYRADAFAEPTFTGSLRLAPGLLGPIRDAPERIDAFRSEVERIVRGASRAYGVVAAEQPTQSRVVLLHVSDLHASGVGMDVAQELAAAFEVDAVLDTGDITSFNTVPERSILDRIPGFEAPYLFVRGNHDSPGTAALIEAQPNGTVLDGEVVEV